MYAENQFTSLVSGMEALHRTLKDKQVDPSFTEKMERILADIENEADRKWLRTRTKNFGAPSLEQRLMELFETVPAKVEMKSLREFCGACARMRNGLSHRGHAPDMATSGDMLQRVMKMNAVIGFFYHAKLLLEIGTPATLVERWLNDSYQSYRIQWCMDQAGLTLLKPLDLTEEIGGAGL